MERKKARNCFTNTETESKSSNYFTLIILTLKTKKAALENRPPFKYI